MSVRFLLNLTLISISFILGGCEVSVSESEVIGMYDLQRTNGVETLEIKMNHQFLHVYRPATGQGFEHKGSWRWYSSGDESRIVFKQFIFGPTEANDFKIQNLTTEWPAEVLKDSITGSVKIWYSNDGP
jgi:hypothetical protein